jgi:hypothetical protein
MTQVTPPGWYPDPGQTSDGPATERWWDGKAWTDRIRPAGAAAAAGPPAQPQDGPADAGARGGDGEADAAARPQDGRRDEAGQAARQSGGAGDPAEKAAGQDGDGAAAQDAPAAPDRPGEGGGKASSSSAPGQPPASHPAPPAPQSPPAAPGPYGPPGPYGQPGPYGGPAAYGQPGPHGQPNPYAQPAAYGQPGQPASPAYPGYPPYAGQPAPAPRGPRRGLRTGVAVAAAAAVLASIGAGVYVLSQDDGGSSNRAGSHRSSGGSGGFGDREGSGGQDGPFGGPDRDGDGGAGGSTEPPKIRSGSVSDPLSGISLPIPKGWYGQQIPLSGASVSSDESYACPGDASLNCVKGGASSAPAVLLETPGDTPEEVAKADIEANAEQSYGKAYGGIASHQVLASEPVTVAGEQGYMVRWKANTRKGSDGYVESLAFRAPGTGRMVVVRFGVDVDQGTSVIDEITAGIKKASGAGSGESV